MNAALSVLLFALSLVPPQHFYFRYGFISRSTTVTRDEVVAALEKGLFADSVIVRGEPRKFPTDLKDADTSLAARPSRTITLMAVINLESDTSSIRVSVTMKNLLAQAVAGPDTLRTTRAGLDSAVTESGRRIAKQLALIGRR